MARTQECKISLSELPRKTTASVSYMVKTPNFFILPENDDTEVESNSLPFEFAKATWQFVFKSKGKYKMGRWIRKIKVSLEKFSSEVRVISYSIMLLDADNEKHDHHYATYKYDKGINNRYLWTFRSSNLFCDKRDTLTLIIHLISDELPEENVIQVSPSTKTGMAERAKSCRISLSELPRKTLSSVNYLIKMPNFFAQPEYIDKPRAINSQPFEFCGASWQFLLIPGEKYKVAHLNTEELTREFTLYLVRLKSEVRKHWISSTIVSVDEDGEEDIFDNRAFLYKEGQNDFRLSVFSRSWVTFYHGLDALTWIIRLICEESPDEYVDEKPLNKEQRDFKRLFLSGKNHDLTLRVAEKEFRVHKDVLMARSPVFLSMLSHNMTEKNEGFIDIPDCDPQAMEQFLFYVYCGRVETLNKDNVIGLYYIADKYNTDLLKKQCSSFIKKSISPVKVCDVISLSMKHSDADLLEYATEYFLNHTDDIFPTSEWMSFLSENLTTANELLCKASKKWKKFT